VKIDKFSKITCNTTHYW